MRGSIPIFVDERYFIVNEIAKPQNSPVIARSPSHIPPVMQSKKLVSAIVFALAVGYGKVMPANFIEAGLETNTDDYFKIFNDVFCPVFLKT